MILRFNPTTFYIKIDIHYDVMTNRQRWQICKQRLMTLLEMFSMYLIFTSAHNKCSPIAIDEWEDARSFNAKALCVICIPGTVSHSGRWKRSTTSHRHDGRRENHVLQKFPYEILQCTSNTEWAGWLLNLCRLAGQASTTHI